MKPLSLAAAACLIGYAIPPAACAAGTAGPAAWPEQQVQLVVPFAAGTAPDVPTMVEAGFRDLEVSSWFGLFAPAGTPQAVVQRLYETTAAALTNAGVRERFTTLGAEPVGNSPATFSRMIAIETPRWASVLKDVRLAGADANR